MTKIAFTKITAVIVVLSAAYFISTIYVSDFWGNLLSPLNAFTAVAVLIFAYLKSDRKAFLSSSYLFFALACFIWGTTDVIWAVLYFRGLDPSAIYIIDILYMLPNIVIIVTIFLIMLTQFSKWNAIQTAVDSFIITVMTLVLIWIVFFNKDASSFTAFFQCGIHLVISIATDILILINILSWFLSVRSGRIPFPIKLITFSLMLYACVDIYYFYLDFNGLYIPNSLIDLIYMLAFQLLAFGALLETYYKSPVELNNLTNAGKNRRWYYLLVFPALATLLHGIDILFVFVYAMLIFLYHVSSNYVQLSIENARLLENERNANEILELRIQEQIRELSYLANQDTLTSLFNRRFFISCLDDCIKTRLNNEVIAVLLIDLDRFKTINDSYGHNIGDSVLVELAYRLIAWNSCGATLARLGGDEFAVIISGKYSQQEIDGLCRQIIKLCSTPFRVFQDALHLTISLGAALYSSEADNSMTLLKNADIAMYRAKSQGYNKYLFYDPFFTQQADKNIEIEKLLRSVNFTKDFELFYQPQFSLPEKKLIGAEALLRWKSLEHGYIPPNEFIPVAEEIDAIFEIGNWVIHETIRQAEKWNNAYALQLKLAFNVSPKQFYDDSFVETIREQLAKPEFNPAWIDAEITESIMIKDGTKVKSILVTLNSFGISVSIDDFGSGYSALGYLNSFPFDRIKIDKTLIDNVTSTNVSGIQVVKAIISMAQAVGMKTIAEGVESQEQLDILTELGCDQVQGYLLGRPVPAHSFEVRFIQTQLED